MLAEEQDHKNEGLDNYDETSNESKAEDPIDSTKKNDQQINLGTTIVNDMNDTSGKKPLLKQLKGKVSSLFRGGSKQ